MGDNAGVSLDVATLVAPERHRIADVLAAVTRGLEGPERAVELYGAAGALGPALAAELARRSPGPLLYLVADDEGVESRLADLSFFLPPVGGADDPLAPPAALELPAPESSPYAEMQPERRTIMRRMAVR